MRVHGALRPAGRARGIEPEGGVVRTRAGGAEKRGIVVQKGLKLDLAEFERLRRTRHDNLVDLMVRLGQRAFQRRFQCAADDRGLRARVLEHVGVVVGGEQRVDGDRNDARQHRAQESDRPVGAVEHEQQYALLALDARALERRGEFSRARVEFAIGQGAGVVDKRDLVRASGVCVQKMLGEIENLRGRAARRDALGHVVPPPVLSSRACSAERQCNIVRLALVVGSVTLCQAG